MLPTPLNMCAVQVMAYYSILAAWPGFARAFSFPHDASNYVCVCTRAIAFDKLAIIADKVSEVVGSSSTICAATTVPPPSQSSSCSVQPTMDSLARQIQELSVNRGSGICYYHRRYKEQARKCVSPCAFVQKRVSSVIAGMAEPSKHTSRLFLLDRKSGQKFLIDSGNEICVIPPSPTMNKSLQSNFSLFAANNTKIPAYGMVRKELNLGLRRPLSGLS
ncbi:uncharacterized protein TNCV_3397161 [Trichonephila clavipes]|nr:uncharacterized protein TNCV_3397161 [Trichonephila clavipes]